MPVLNKATGLWEKTPKELEREQTKVNLEDRVAEQEQQIATLTATLGDFMLGGL